LKRRKRKVMKRILDGNHRFAKMIQQNKRKVKIVYFTKKELDKLKIKM